MSYLGHKNVLNRKMYLKCNINFTKLSLKLTIQMKYTSINYRSDNYESIY